MWNFDLTQTGSRITLLIGQFIVLILCLSYMGFIYSANILPDKQAKESYQQTDCFVISKRLAEKGKLYHQYRSDFLISYSVNGVQYNRWVSGNGLDMSFSRNQYEQEFTLSQYDVGGTYPCWYNPENPQLAILVLRHNWLSTFPLVVPAIIGLITLYYLMKNLTELTSVASVKTREKVRERRARKLKKKEDETKNTF